MRVTGARGPQPGKEQTDVTLQPASGPGSVSVKTSKKRWPLVVNIATPAARETRQERCGWV